MPFPYVMTLHQSPTNGLANKGFHLYKDDYFYTSYSSLAMFSFKEQLGDKNKVFSPQMQEYFKTQDRKSNPVIIQLKPKKH